MSTNPPVGAARRVLVLGPLAVAAMLVAGCSSGTTPSTSPTATVGTASVSAAGTVVVTGGGYTLYLFEPDHQSASTCSGPCAAAWPPYLLPNGMIAPRGTGGARESLLGTVRRSDGSVQVTYNRWPLYRWVGDIRPGVDTGQGLNQFGGYWYVVSASGAAVTH